MVLSFKNVNIIKDPGICLDVLRNTTDNFTVTRVSGLSCDQMTGLEKWNRQLLFAVCDGETAEARQPQTSLGLRR
jgi:hypothetical protein